MPYIHIGTRAYRWTLISMLLGSIVTYANLYSPQTLIYIFSEQFLLAPSTASFAISFTTFTLAICMLFVTVFSDAWGRKPIMVVSLFATSLLTILISLSPNFQTFLVLRILQGIVLSGFPAIAIIYLNEEVSPQHVGRIIGIYIGGSAFGAFLGRVLISSLTDLFSWHIAYFILGVASLIGSVLFATGLPSSQNFRRNTLSFMNWASGTVRELTNPKLLYVYGIGMLMLGVYVAMFNYIGFPLSKPPFHLSQTQIGYIIVCQLAGSWSSYYFGKITDRHSHLVLMGGALTMAIIGAWMTLSMNIVVIIIGLTLFASGFLAGHSLASSWIGKLTHSRSTSYATSWYFFFYYMGSSLIGWSGGLFLSRFGWVGVVAMIIGLLALTGLLVRGVGRLLRLPRHEKRAIDL